MDYSSEVRRRFPAPARAGAIPPSAGQVVEGAAEDRSQSFWIRFQVRSEGPAIACVRFQAYGCPHSLAAADWIAEQLEGKPLAALASIDIEAVAGLLKVPRDKLGKLLRIEDALAECYARAVSSVKG